MFGDMTLKIQGNVAQYEDDESCGCQTCKTNKVQVGRWTMALRVVSVQDGSSMTLINPGRFFFDTEAEALDFLRAEGMKAHETTKKVLDEMEAEYTAVNMKTGDIIAQSLGESMEMIKRNMPRATDAIH